MAILQRPVTDYLAKDYESFRQLMLDRLSTTLPAWRERHATDLGITIVEAIAHVADQLSQFQDAVATEAYLSTARQRISVRRHARLIDYVLHEGCNARAWVHLDVRTDSVSLDLGRITLLANALQPAPAGATPSTVDAAQETFAPLSKGSRTFYRESNEIALCEPLVAGATRALIRSGAAARLQIGDVLIIAGENPDGLRAYHPVILVSPLESDRGEIVWHPDDALPGWIADVRHPVALGNNVLVDHGKWVKEWRCEVHAGRLRLARAGVTHSTGYVWDGLSGAAPMMAQNSSEALPAIELYEEGRRWGLLRPDLLSSSIHERHFCAEFDDDGHALIRFANGPNSGSAKLRRFGVRYRIGNGPTGNVPARTITQILQSGQPLPGVDVYNPLPASGGTEPQSVRTARLVAPRSIVLKQPRAITAEDYEGFATSIKGVRRAAVRISTQGIWRLVEVAVDPEGFRPPWVDAHPPAVWSDLCKQVLAVLEPVRCLNHHLAVIEPRYVELDVRLRIDVLPNRAVSEVLADADASLAAMFGDDLSFGQSVGWSRIAAGILGVPGVANVVPNVFGRADRPERLKGNAPDLTTIRIGHLELPFLPSVSHRIEVRNG